MVADVGPQADMPVARQLAGAQDRGGVFVFQNGERVMRAGRFRQKRGAVQLPDVLRRVLPLAGIAGQTPGGLAAFDQMLRALRGAGGVIEVVLCVIDLRVEIFELVDVGVVEIERVRRLFGQRQFGCGDVLFPLGQHGLDVPLAAEGVDDGGVDVFQAGESLLAADDGLLADAEARGGRAD